MGKGRQLAGLVHENVLRGRFKHVWFSTSNGSYIYHSPCLFQITPFIFTVLFTPHTFELSVTFETSQ